MGKVIGIDLGTTNSCVAVVENEQAVIIPSDTGARTTPSVVAFTKFGERLVGEAAKRQQVTNPDRTFSSIKREMGTNWSANVDGTIQKPQTISAQILMQLKKNAEGFLGHSVSDAVITVPAYFNDAQRQATKDAGAIAGLNVLRIINEPTSAALSYGLNHGEPQKVMVYDLGGGTFDVSIIEIGEGVVEVLATAGDNHLGGDDFDEAVASWLVEQCKTENRVNPSKDYMAMQRIREAAEQAKKELSTAMSATINLPYLVQKGGEPIHLEAYLTRSEFDAITRHLVERTEGPVRDALQSAGLSAGQLSKVLLVGGSTRIPAVQAKVRQLTGMEPSQNLNPDECVAQGAAIQGHILEGNQIVAKGSGTEHGIVLFDVTPMSLSIETLGGVATHLMEKNTVIPNRMTKIFTTSAPFQTTVEIKVLQGDRPMARDNKQIGIFKLKGIRPAPAGVPQIEVAFDIDANGILKVTARDLGTGRSQEIVITADDRMTEQEIQQAMRDAQMNSGVDMVKKEGYEENQKSAVVLRKAITYQSENKRGMDREMKKQLKDDIKELQRCVGKFKLETVTEQDVAEMRVAREKVERDCGF